MNPIIKKILIPVEFDEEHLSIVMQTAEIAKKHNAALHLIHVQKPNISNYINQIFNYKKQNSIYSITKNKTNLIHTWRRWIEKEFGIEVKVSVDWGNWKKIVLEKAFSINANLIALNHHQEKSWVNIFLPTRNNYIIDKSPCQVITFITEGNSISNWRNIVIPVTNFIPENRINTIIEIVKYYNIKLHLIAFSTNTIVSHKSNFYYLTETLKLLKASGNIQVECKCINPNSSNFKSILQYAKEVKADAIITNKKLNISEQHQTTNSVKSFFEDDKKVHQQDLFPA
ncbi:MAG: universal stress protein [Chitinophagaceae bacterium]|nr:universal stress protein [Chitinophagaceae bacterium]